MTLVYSVSLCVSGCTYLRHSTPLHCLTDGARVCVVCVVWYVVCGGWWVVCGVGVGGREGTEEGQGNDFCCEGCGGDGSQKLGLHGALAFGDTGTYDTHGFARCESFESGATGATVPTDSAAVDPSTWGLRGPRRPWMRSLWILRFGGYGGLRWPRNRSCRNLTPGGDGGPSCQRIRALRILRLAGYRR